MAALLIGALGLVGWILSRKPGGISPVQNPVSPLAVLITSSTPPTQASSTTGLKTYRNTDFGFEFQYPDKWSFEVGSFYSPFSKFNLQGDSSAKDYNPLLPVFLLNVVMPDFADSVIMGWRQSGSIESEIVVGDVHGKKFEYTKPHPGVSIILPFGKYGIILATKNKDHEDIFNQILATFKFLK